MFSFVCVISDFVYQYLIVSEYWSSASLGRSIPRYFILFDVLVSGIVSLMSISDLSLLVYKNARDFFCVCVRCTRCCIYSFLAALGLHGCTWALCNRREQGLLSVAAHRRLLWRLPLWSTGARRVGVSSCGVQTSCSLLAREHGSSLVVVDGLSCSVACGVFPDQGSNPCPLHWQAASYPLCHKGSPRMQEISVYYFGILQLYWIHWWALVAFWWDL